MANPVLNDKRFTATADELEPRWAAPARAAADPTTAAPTTAAAGAPPATTPAVRTMAANGTFAKTFLLWALLLVGGAFGWSQVTVDKVGNVSIPGWIFI